MHDEENKRGVLEIECDKIETTEQNVIDFETVMLASFDDLEYAW